jgi:hypothetical protein
MVVRHRICSIYRLIGMAGEKEARASGARAAGLGGGRLNALLRAVRYPCHEQPVVEPQVSHFRQVPLRTRVKLAQLGQGSPS